ncbi:BlaI/MecI/CopY family transcriptional regulator [Lachnospiraceae bacterium NSJ-143]|nr:BlaI/MecI/CopY family transcriptional regulator [Lachnospiraceae bacterium NSJ-143]
MIKLYDSEFKVMEVLWKKGPQYAKDISLILMDEIGWSKNTTYTILNKLINKSYILREEPQFKCIPLITRQQVQTCALEDIKNKMFGGSPSILLSSLLNLENLSMAELDYMQLLLDKSKEKRENDK